MRDVALREWLLGLHRPVTYAEAMQALAVPHMRDLTQALEILMEQDVAAGRPLVAALVVSRVGPLPNRGFFDKARTLGLVIGDAAGFIADQQARLFNSQRQG